MAVTPLTRLMSAGRPGGSAVSVRGDRVVDWATFGREVGVLRDRLTAAADPGTRRWAVHTDDAYAFAVALMAIWQVEGVAVVLPNSQPGAVRDAAGSVRGIVTDVDLANTGIAPIPALSHERGAWRNAVALRREAPAVELFTSGTTGDRKAIVKTLAHLEDEVAGLEHSWGARLGDRRAIGTVSHQHIYGMLFRVLWPLSAARVFCRDPLVYPDEMLAGLGGAPGYLVSTPAHLRRLCDMRNAEALVRVCRPLFSSGGPVGEATAARCAETFGVAPIEVLGSTETGGVAWRQQDGKASSIAWTPFDDVRVSVDAAGALHVSSPRVSAPGSFTMADRADPADGGRFVLRGRADRVVKIAGKRLSLPEMEEHLLRHPSVAEAVLTVVDPTGEPRVAAAVVLSEKGERHLAETSRRALSNELIGHLAAYWDRVLLPRAFRYVARLPEDAQGKVVSAALAALFAPAGSGTGWRPEILAEQVEAHAATRRVRVPEDAAFDGHFPEVTVVPGFVQIEWVMDLAARLMGRRMTLTQLDAVKFRDVLRPEQIIAIRVERVSDSSALAFRITREDGRLVSQGRCSLAEEHA